MLKSVHVRNFKAWRKLNISLGDVTGIFGTNSSGKSSILQFLLLLKQTKNATDRSLTFDFGGPDQLVNLGSFRDLIFKHKIDETLSWEITWSRPSKLLINDPSGKRTEILASGHEITHRSLAHMEGLAPISDRVEYSLGEYTFSIAPKKLGSTEYELKAKGPTDGSFRFKRTKARAWALPGPIKTHLFPDQAKTYFQNSDFLGLFEAAYESMLDSIFYLGPLREYPRREYSWSGVRPSDVGRRGDRTVEAILSATLKGEKRNLGGKTHYRTFQEIIAYWLKELGLIHSFRVEEIGLNSNLYRTVVKRGQNSPDAALTDVGIGVSQVLPALVLLYYVPEGSTVLLEQPEIHLHPSVQSGLADVILQVASSRNLQVVVESHSEHMLRRFQRRVAEGRATTDSIKMYFCSNVEGESELSNLELDVFGGISNWPDNFFGDEMGEIAATQKAALTRRMQVQK